MLSVQLPKPSVDFSKNPVKHGEDVTLSCSGAPNATDVNPYPIKYSWTVGTKTIDSGTTNKIKQTPTGPDGNFADITCTYIVEAKPRNETMTSDVKTLKVYRE